MSLGGHPYVPQPFIAYVDFLVNGQNLTRMEGGQPTHLQRFSFRKKSKDSTSTFTIQLFDPEWINIEKVIIEGKDNVQFKYYYIGPESSGMGLTSPWYEAKILTYTPTFVIDGVELNIEGTSHVMSKGGDECKTRAFEKKLISEIVEEICEDNGWKTIDADGSPTIDKTQEVLDYDDLTSSDYVDRQFRQARVSDLQFIKYHLLPLSIRESDGVGGYKLFFDDVTGCLHFHPPRLEKPPIRSFYFMRGDPNSEVISFAPTIGDKQMISLGGGELAIPTFDSVTGQQQFIRINQNHYTEPNTGAAIPNDKKTVQGRTTNEQDLSEKDEQSGRVLQAHAPNSDQGVQRVKASWFKAFNAQYKAQIVTLGDPRLNVEQTIRMYVILPNGSTHYTSGHYMIETIEDAIEPGMFTSTIDCSKNAGGMGDVEALGVQADPGGPQ